MLRKLVWALALALTACSEEESSVPAGETEANQPLSSVREPDSDGPAFSASEEAILTARDNEVSEFGDRDQYDYVMDTALGRYAIKSTPLPGHYRTQAYGPHWAGAIEALPSGVLVMNAAGEVLFFRSEDEVEYLGVVYENNRPAFLEYLPHASWRWAHNFRFFDIQAIETDYGARVYISLNYWDRRHNCHTVRLIERGLDIGEGGSSPSWRGGDWRVVFETSPCIEPDPELTWYGYEGGGALDIKDGFAYLAVGHFGLLGQRGQPVASQDPDLMLGRTFRIDLESGESQVLSLGHRNPQGFIALEDGLLLTEHGPQGGDELNLILEDRNYGWPLVTLGTQYGEESWDFDTDSNPQYNVDEPAPGRHMGYELPMYSWVPSIGVSSLLQVHNFNPEWEGDLLVASLNGHAVRRLRLDGPRVVYDEPIDFGERIRDISQAPDGGPIFVLTDEADLVEIRPAPDASDLLVADDPNLQLTTMPGWPRAEARIEACGVCHSYERGLQSNVAPNLFGIVGREIGGTDFEGYSEGWLALDGVWTEEALDRLLREPTSFSSTSIMASQTPVADPEEREAMIAFFLTLR
ncbi:MAG: PQQ-dependent sugar dehydrogenase [Pseudomonadota bacterium]